MSLFSDTIKELDFKYKKRNNKIMASNHLRRVLLIPVFDKTF